MHKLTFHELNLRAWDTQALNLVKSETFWSCAVTKRPTNVKQKASKLTNNGKNAYLYNVHWITLGALYGQTMESYTFFHDFFPFHFPWFSSILLQNLPYLVLKTKFKRCCMRFPDIFWGRCKMTHKIFKFYQEIKHSIVWKIFQQPLHGTFTLCLDFSYNAS